MTERERGATRVLLLTGKGGVGKTTTAAGTAMLGGERGLRTLVLSTDAAHSLGDAFGVEPARSGGHVAVAEHVWIQQVDAQRRFEESWASIHEYLRTILDAAGADPITAEEITVLPGAEEVIALLALRDEVASGAWDLVVVDCAPTAETLRLLALPEALGWYLHRLTTSGSRVVKTVTPALARAAGVPMPEPAVAEAVQRLHADLREVRTLLTAPETSVRLVLTPESVVVAEARRALTTLSLYGYTVDGVVANRVFPDSGDDPWRRRWAEAQRETLAEVDESFAPLPVWRTEYAESEPVGAERSYALPGPRTTGLTRWRSVTRRRSWRWSVAGTTWSCVWRSPSPPGERSASPATARTWWSPWGRTAASWRSRPCWRATQ